MIPDRFAQRFGPGDAVRLGVVLILVVGTLAPAVGAVSVNDMNDTAATPSDTVGVADDRSTVRRKLSPELTVRPSPDGDGFDIELSNLNQSARITVNGAPVGSVDGQGGVLDLGRSQLRRVGDGLGKAEIVADLNGSNRRVNKTADLRVVTPADKGARVSGGNRIEVPVSPIGFDPRPNANVKLTVSNVTGETSTSVSATLSPNQSGYGRLLVNPADLGDLAYPPGPIKIHGVSLRGENLSEGGPSLSVPLGSLAENSTSVTSQGEEVVIDHLLINSGETYHVTFQTQSGTLTRSVTTNANANTNPTLRVGNSRPVVRSGPFDVSVSQDGRSVIRGHRARLGGGSGTTARVKTDPDTDWSSIVNVNIGSIAVVSGSPTVETVWVNTTQGVRSYSDVDGKDSGQNLTLNFSEAGVEFREGGRYEFIIRLEGSQTAIRASTDGRDALSDIEVSQSDDAAAGETGGSGLGVPGDSGTVVLVTVVGVVAILATTGGAILYTRRTDDTPMPGTGTNGTSKSAAGPRSGARTEAQSGPSNRRSTGNGPNRGRGRGGTPGSTGHGGGAGAGRIQQVPVTVSVVDGLSGTPITRELNYEAGIRSRSGRGQTGSIKGGKATIQLPAGDCFVAVGNQTFREEAVVNTNKVSTVTIEVDPVPVDLQIVDENKRPLKGATVTCSPAGVTGQERTKRTDNRGNARLHVPRTASRVRIEATADGFENKSFEQELDPPVKGKVSLLEAPSEVRATVTVDGESVEGIPVVVEGSGEGGGLSAQQSADTDADGSVSFGGLRAGTYTVGVDVDGSHLDVPSERIDLGRGTTTEVRLRVSSRFELSADQRERVRNLRSRVRDLSAASDRDTAIPHYFGTVLGSLLDLIEMFPEQAGHFSLAGHDPDRLVTSLLDTAEDATGAVETAMRSKRSVDLFSVCASLPAAEVDWSSDYQSEALRALLDGERDPASQFEARLDAVRSTLDDQQRSLTDVSPVETLYDEIESEFDTPDSPPDFDSDEQPVEGVVGVFVALGVLAAIESLFDHEPLRERLDQTVF